MDSYGPCRCSAALDKTGSERLPGRFLLARTGRHIWDHEAFVRCLNLLQAPVVRAGMVHRQVQAHPVPGHICDRYKLLLQ